MRDGRGLRWLAMLVGLLALWPLTAAVGQGNEPLLDKYGWWNANQTLPADPTGGALPPLEVPAPPGAPDDGIYVEVAASGTTLAIGGVNFFTGGGVNASLTLTLVEGSAPAGLTLAACPAGGGWDAAQNGRWDRRPTYEPKTCTFLGTARNNTVTFSIPAAAHEPGSAYLSLAIVPAEGSGAFARGLSPAELGVAGDDTGAHGDTDPVGDSPAPALEPGPVTFGGDAYALPSVAAPAATPTTAPRRNTAAAPRAARNTSDDDEQGSARVIAVLALVVIGATMVVSTRRSQRGPRLIGSLGADATTEARDAA